MKKHITGIFAVLLMLSCQHRDWEPRLILVTREVHYDFETGLKLGEKTFTYDENGNMIRDYFSSATDPANDAETLFEYNAQKLATKKMVRYPNQSPVFHITEYNYVDARLKSETTYSDNSLLGYRTIYFYSSAVADSSQHFSYSTIDEKYVYNTTVYYEYNDSWRRVRALDSNGSITLYRYVGPRLAATCNVRTGYNGEVYEDCIENEYDSDGLLIRVSATAPGQTQVNEELSYRGFKLSEKLIYSYPAYDPGNTVDVVQIKYEYNTD